MRDPQPEARSPKPPPTVFWYGRCPPDYPRNRLTRAALRHAGYHLRPCATASAPLARDATRGLDGSWGLMRRALAEAGGAVARWYRALHAPAADLLWVGYPGLLDLLFVRSVPGRAVCADVLVSPREALADRGLIRPGGRFDRLLARLERRAAARADVFFVESRAQAAWFTREYALPSGVVAVLYGGGPIAPRGAIPTPRGASAPPPVILFAGKFSPLHGVEVVAAAMDLVRQEPWRWEIIGRGQVEFPRPAHEAARPDSSRVRRVPWLPFPQLVRATAAADLCLGIFSTGARAQRVIPNKVLLALCCGVPVLTAETPAVRELLVPDDSVLTCPAGDPAALAAALRAALADRDRLRRVGAAGREAVRARSSVAQTAVTIAAAVRRAPHRRRGAARRTRQRGPCRAPGA